MYVILSWGKMLLFDEPYHVTVVEKKGLYFQTQALQSFNTLLLCAASYLRIYFFNRADQTLSSPHKRRKLLINSPWHFIQNCMNCYRCAAYVCTSSRITSAAPSRVGFLFVFFSQHSAWSTQHSFQGRVQWRRCRRLRTSHRRSSWLCRWWPLPWRTARPPCPWSSRKWPQLWKMKNTVKWLIALVKVEIQWLTRGTNLSLSNSWEPTGGLHQHRDRCSEPLRPPLPHSLQVEAEEGELALQRHQCPLGEVEEVGLGCLLLKHGRKQRW